MHLIIFRNQLRSVSHHDSLDVQIPLVDICDLGIILEFVTDLLKSVTFIQDKGLDFECLFLNRRVNLICELFQELVVVLPQALHD